MDGIGSRLGRASSRYGPAPVFNGPVRRWKKLWVHVSSSSSSTLTHHSTTSFHSNNGNGNGNNAPSVRLPRWTPVSSSSISGDSVKSEEPPRRKLRYTPIVVLEEKKKNAGKGADYECRAGKTNRSIAGETTESNDVKKQAVDNILTEETQAYKRFRDLKTVVLQMSDKDDAVPKLLNRSRMDLDLSLNGHDGDHDSDGENKVPDWGRVKQN